MVESPTFFNVSTNESLVNCTARAEEDGKSYNVTIEWISDANITLDMCSNSNSCVLDVSAIGRTGPTVFHCNATFRTFSGSNTTTVYFEGSTFFVFCNLLIKLHLDPIIVVESPTSFNVSTNGSLVNCTGRAEINGMNYNVTIEWKSDATSIMCKNSNSCVLDVSAVIGNPGQTVFRCIATYENFNESSSTTVYFEGMHSISNGFLCDNDCHDHSRYTNQWLHYTNT